MLLRTMALRAPKAARSLEWEQVEVQGSQRVVVASPEDLHG